MASQKIIFVNRFFYPDHSATAQLLSNLAFRVPDDAHRVLIVTSNGLYDQPAAGLPTEEHLGEVDVRRVYRPLFGRRHLLGRAIDYALMYCAFALAVLKLARPGDVIVAKTDPPLLSVALLPVSLYRGATLINWLQDLYPEVAVALGMKVIVLLSPILTQLRNVSLRHAGHNVTIGDRMKARLVSSGVPDEKISVIPNWCPDDNVRPLDPPNPLRQAWGLEGKFVVAYSGNLGRAHEFDTLLGAAEILKDDDRLLFLFIGGGALIQRLRDEVERRGLHRLFEFRPYQAPEGLHASLTLPDIFWVSLRPEMEGLIVPSKFYGNCAAGRPTIFVGDPEGEIGRVIEKCDCGLNVRAGDAGQFAEAIRMLMLDDARLQAMGCNARLASETTFDKRQAIESWKGLIFDKIMQDERTEDAITVDPTP